MEQKPSPPVTAQEAVAQNLRAWRKEVGKSQDQLALEMNATGVPMTRSRLAKIEVGLRDDLTLSEIFAAALALNVAPVDLLVPPTATQQVALTPETSPESAYVVRKWLVGEDPLLGSLRAAYDVMQSDTATDEQRRAAARVLPDFYRHAPEEVARLQVLRNTPFAQPIEDLQAILPMIPMLRDASRRRAVANNLRDALERLTTEINVACHQLEWED